MQFTATFKKIAKQFSIEFDELAAEISHNLTSGESREYALRKLLKKYLPQRVGVDRGFVIDAKGGESLQIDIVIYDRTAGAVFKTNKVKYFPCESVLAVGEVKSNIESTKLLTDSLAKISSVKKLDRSNGGTNKILSGPGISIPQLSFDPTRNHRDQIFGFIFTSTSMTRPTFIDRVQNYNKSTDRRLWPNLFCAHREFLLSYETSGALYPSAMDAINLYCTEDSESENLILLFYSILATFVDEGHIARVPFFSYAQILETKATYHSLMPAASS